MLGARAVLGWSTASAVQAREIYVYAALAAEVEASPQALKRRINKSNINARLEGVLHPNKSLHRATQDMERLKSGDLVWVH